MKDSLKIEGQWHIHGKDQPPVYGELTSDPEAGLTLNAKILRASGDYLPGAFANSFACPETIHGFDSRRQPITLLACMVSQASNSDSLDTYEIRPLLGIVGEHFGNWQEVKAQTVSATLSLLDPWLNRSTIRQTIESERSVFVQKPLPEIEIRLPDNEQIVITCSYSQTGGHGELHLKQQHVTHFNFATPEPLSKVRNKYIHVFRQLISFLTGSEVFIDSIHFGRGFTRCDLLSRNDGATTAQRKLSYGRVLVHYNDLNKAFPSLVARWFRYYSEMEAILNLYFAARWNKDIPITTKFLLLAQALEAYHSRSSNYTSAVQDKSEFRQRICTLLRGVVDRQEKDWLREKLQHANQKTLAQRLSDLIVAHQKDAAQFLKDPDDFATTIRHARNYFTHYDEELRRKGKIPSATTLSHLTLQMRALLEICFLRDLGLPELAIQRVIRGVQDVRYVSLESEGATF